MREREGERERERERERECNVLELFQDFPSGQKLKTEKREKMSEKLMKDFLSRHKK